MGVFQQAFERLVSRGYDVLCLTITGRHSGTFNSAKMAAQPFGDRVVVWDSLSLSWGLGWQAIRAARMAREGATMEEILQALHSLRERSHILILLDTLEHLRRGGRASQLFPIIDRIARALHIKVLLSVEKGELKLFGAVRSFNKGMQRIVREVSRLGPLESLCVMHMRNPEAGEKLAQSLAQATGIPRERIPIGEAGAVLAVHGGKGLVAALAVVAP